MSNTSHDGEVRIQLCSDGLHELCLHNHICLKTPIKPDIVMYTRDPSAGEEKAGEPRVQGQQLHSESVVQSCHSGGLEANLSCRVNGGLPEIHAVLSAKKKRKIPQAHTCKPILLEAVIHLAV